MQFTDLEDICYRGEFFGTIEGSDARLGGQAVVTFNAVGRPEIAVDLDRDSSRRYLNAEAPDGVLRASNRISFREVSVVGQNGSFQVTHRPFLLGTQLTLGAAETPHLIRISALRSEFVAARSGTPRYWAFPTWNLAWQSRPCFYPGFDGHILSLPCNRLSAPNRVLHPELLVFEFEGEEAFVQKVDGYRDWTESLEAQRCGRAVTAMVAGAVGERSFEFPPDQPGCFFPLHLCSWLTFATGSFVGSPYIELLDASGNLLKRIHIPFGGQDFASGRYRLDELQTPGVVGHLLTQALGSALFGQSEQAIPLLLLNESGARSGSLEYRKVQLSRAFELVARSLGVDRHEEVLDALSASNLDDAQRIVREAATQLESLGAVEADTVARGMLERLAGKVRSIVGGKENDFGTKVAEVANRYGLKDPSILNSHFGSNPIQHRSTWPRVLSLYRNEVLHEGYLAFDANGGHLPFHATVSLIDHLEDILVRVLLKSVDYTGTYRAFVRAPQSQLPVGVDWVTDDTTIEKLGFSSTV